MGFEKVADIIHDITVEYGEAEVYMKKYLADTGGKSHFKTPYDKEWESSKLIVGVIQEEFKEEEIVSFGKDKKLDVIFNVSSLELSEKGFVPTPQNQVQKDVMIYNGVVYDIVNVKFHKLQAIELYRFIGVRKLDKLPNNDSDIEKVTL